MICSNRIVLIFTLLMVFAFTNTQAQKTTESATVSSEEITAKEFKSVTKKYLNASRLEKYYAKHLEIICSDAMEGRETGSKGIKIAADHIKGELKKAGLSANDENGDYLQDVLFRKTKWKKNEISINGIEEKMLRHFYSLTMFAQPLNLTSETVSFLGYGIQAKSINHFKKKPKSKLGLIYGGQPLKEDGSPAFPELEERDYAWMAKIRNAQNNGIEVLFVIDKDFKENAGRMNRFILNPQFEMINDNESYDGPTIVSISPKMAEDMFGANKVKLLKKKAKLSKKRRFKSIEIPCQVEMDYEISKNEIKDANITAFIEGSDPKLKEEVLVISAHYDHLGIRGEDIYNGADDNGSGTTGVLTLAKQLAKIKKDGHDFKRSVQFLFFTGEEKGLLGSEFYTEHPIVDLDNIVADINIDMIGRVDKNHTDPNYIYVIGADKISQDLHDWNEESNAQGVNLDLDYTYNDENDPNRFYYRSDHYNFAKNGIPVVFFFSGVHDDYHMTTDTFEKIDIRKACKIVELAGTTALKVINAPARPRITVE